MFSEVFEAKSFADLLKTPLFWYILFIAIVAIIVFIYSIKYWSQGGKYVVLALFTIVLTVLTVYSSIQLNYYYSAQGGIHGAITGIFETNKIEVVDDLSFKLDNIELTKVNDTTYSAGIIVDKSVSINTRENLGVLINDVPCTTSEIHEDYALAKYTYTFYDNNQLEILTDTLLLNIAFNSNSTYLEVSTSGNSSAIDLWNSYFNKNNFVVKIVPFKNSYNFELEFDNGDISNYSVVNYYFNSFLYETKVYTVGQTLTLPLIDNVYYNWYVDNEIVSEHYVVSKNIDVYSYSEEFIEANRDGTFEVNIYNSGTEHCVYRFNFVVENNVFKHVEETYDEQLVSSINYNKTFNDSLLFVYTVFSENFNIGLIYDIETQCWKYDQGDLSTVVVTRLF